jgi:hypothetical protein
MYRESFLVADRKGERGLKPQGLGSFEATFSSV